MKKLLLIAVCSLLSFTLTGCTGMAGVARALSKDPAFVSVRIQTIYGTGILVRDGRPGSGDSVTAEGAVSSIPATNVINRLEVSPQLAEFSAQHEQLVALQQKLAQSTNTVSTSSTNSPPAKPAESK